MTVYLVGAGPGDPALITVRGAELLRKADVVVHDRLVDRSLLELAPKGAQLIDAGKTPGSPRSQPEISALLIRLADTFDTVVRLKGGDPFVFGRGGEEVAALHEAGVDVCVVPGVTSAFAAPAYAGIPVTHRGLSTSVTVVTGHVGDASAPGGVDWGALARAGGTIVILMGMANRAEIAAALIDGGRSPETPVALVEWGTTPSQRSVRTTLDKLHEVDLGSPSTIVVGEVARLDLDWLPEAPLRGWTVVVTRLAEKSAGLSERLRLAGASVVTLPSVAVADPEDGGEALARAVAWLGGSRTGSDPSRPDWIAFTSANAVDRFAVALRDGGFDARALSGTRIAAVGPATAAALEAAHIVADLVSAKPSADGLAESLQAVVSQAVGPLRAVESQAVNRPRHVLFVRATEALATFPAGMRKAGWTVSEVEAYRSVTAGPSDGATPDAIGAAAKAQAVVFASPSAVDGFVSHVVGAVGRDLQAAVAVCIGETTADAARKAGFTKVVVAQKPTDEGLVEALLAAAVDARLARDQPAPEPGTQHESRAQPHH